MVQMMCVMQMDFMQVMYRGDVKVIAKLGDMDHVCDVDEVDVADAGDVKDV